MKQLNKPKDKSVEINISIEEEKMSNDTNGDEQWGKLWATWSTNTSSHSCIIRVPEDEKKIWGKM